MALEDVRTARAGSMSGRTTRAHAAYNRNTEQKLMRTHLLMTGRIVVFAGLLASMAGAQPAIPAPPAGFTSLFNGKDLTGWRGRPGGGGVFSPYVEAKFTPEERAAKRAEWNADRDQHWRVDSAKGELVSDGKGVHLATEKAYGDFEIRVDWMLTQACGIPACTSATTRRCSFGIQRARANSGTAPIRGRAVCGTTTRITRGNFRWSKRTTRLAVEHDGRKDGRHAGVGDAKRKGSCGRAGARQLL